MLARKVSLDMWGTQKGRPLHVASALPEVATSAGPDDVSRNVVTGKGCVHWQVQVVSNNFKLNLPFDIHYCSCDI